MKNRYKKPIVRERHITNDIYKILENRIVINNIDVLKYINVCYIMSIKESDTLHLDRVL